MINIFGKLYTLLRRPQVETTEQEPEPTETSDSAHDSDWEHVKEDTNVHNASGTDIDALQKVGNSDEQIVEDGDQAKPNEVGSNDTMDMEAMSKLVEEMQVDEKDNEDIREPTPPPDIPQADGIPNIVQSTPIVEIVPSEPSSTVQVAPPTAVSPPVQAAAQTEAPPTKEEIPPTEASPTQVESESYVDEIPDSKKEEKKDNDEKETVKDKEVDKNVGKPDKKGERSNRRPCHYFNRGMKCYKGNRCHYSHDRETQDEMKENAPETIVREEDFESYSDFVNEMTKHGNIINPKDLLYKLGYLKCGMEAMGSVLVGQYKLAASKNRWNWVGQARYYAELLFPGSWINENLPTNDGRKQGKAKDKPTKKKAKYTAPEQYEGRGGMCQDVRLLENPDLPVISNNFGLKSKGQPNGTATNVMDSKDIEEFVTQYANGIINEAVQMAAGDSNTTDKVIRGAIRDAIDEGLSESIIMEVIEDVTQDGKSHMSSQTPSKRKVNKPDTNRTPRKRPDELAIGFNYLSSELVKHSPKTVNGGIICVDTLPPSQERHEQLAFGFNFHADKLVKESPKSEKGEILIPGVLVTPGHRTRDQLAMGFNYHSNVIVKESPKSCKTENRPAHQGRKKKLYEDIKDENQLVNGNIEIDHTGDGALETIKKNEKERFAFGFSKNAELLAHADKMVVNVLGEKDCNLSNQHTNHLESSMDEERNNSELDDSFVPTMVPIRLPAGSLW